MCKELSGLRWFKMQGGCRCPTRTTVPRAGELFGPASATDDERAYSCFLQSRVSLALVLSAVEGALQRHGSLLGPSMYTRVKHRLGRAASLAGVPWYAMWMMSGWKTRGRAQALVTWGGGGAREVLDGWGNATPSAIGLGWLRGLRSLRTG